MDALEKISHVLNKILMIIGAVAVLFLMSLATINVVLRIFGAPYRGTYELVGYSGAIVIAFALGYTQQQKDHIVVDILSQKFPTKLNRILDGLNYFVTMIFFAIVAWQVSVWGMKVLRAGEVMETLKAIYYPFIFAVAIGFGVLSLALLVDFLKNLFGEEEGA
jgi:TRAP-type C4-dicarboxylate transport system permease small subunit